MLLAIVYLPLSFLIGSHLDHNILLGKFQAPFTVYPRKGGLMENYLTCGLRTTFLHMLPQCGHFYSWWMAMPPIINQVWFVEQQKNKFFYFVFPPFVSSDSTLRQRLFWAPKAILARGVLGVHQITFRQSHHTISVFRVVWQSMDERDVYAKHSCRISYHRHLSI